MSAAGFLGIVIFGMVVGYLVGFTHRADIDAEARKRERLYRQAVRR